MRKQLLKNEKLKSILNEEHEGAIPFEYVIILVIMAVAIFTAWTNLSKELEAKSIQIAEFISNNGHDKLGTGTGN